MRLKTRFSSELLDAVHRSKIIGIRAGMKPHRIIGIWAVVVQDRIFGRSWSVSPNGWYRTFLQDPRGILALDGKKFPIKAVPTKRKQLNDAISKAYRLKYTTPGSLRYVRDLGRPKSRATTMEFVPRRVRS